MKKPITLSYMTWKKGQRYAHQMIPLFNGDLTNQGIVLITTLINTSAGLLKLRESMTRAH